MITITRRNKWNLEPLNGRTVHSFFQKLIEIRESKKNGMRRNESSLTISDIFCIFYGIKSEALFMNYWCTTKQARPHE